MKRYSNIINFFILAARKIIIMNLSSNTYKLYYEKPLIQMENMNKIHRSSKWQTPFHFNYTLSTRFPPVNVEQLTQKKFIISHENKIYGGTLRAKLK